MTIDEKIRIAKYWGYTMRIAPDGTVHCAKDGTSGTSRWLGNSPELNVDNALCQIRVVIWKSINRHIAGGFGRGWT